MRCSAELRGGRRGRKTGHERRIITGKGKGS